MKNPNYGYTMEEFDNMDNNAINIEQRKVTVKAFEIISKFKSIKDRQSFCKEMSEIKIYNN